MAGDAKEKGSLLQIQKKPILYHQVNGGSSIETFWSFDWEIIPPG